MQILELWQYPIKGFGGSQTKSATLENGGYFPYDRHFAISTGGEKIATAKPGVWFQKAHFMQLMSNEALAEYSCRYQNNGAEPVLELLHRGKSCISIKPIFHLPENHYFGLNQIQSCRTFSQPSPKEVNPQHCFPACFFSSSACLQQSLHNWAALKWNNR